MRGAGHRADSPGARGPEARAVGSSVPTPISDAVGAERLGTASTPRARLEVERFRLARGLVLLLVVSGASAGARAVGPGGAPMVGACLACLVAAAVVERLSRRRLVERLARESERAGHAPDAAGERARAIVDRLVHGCADPGAAPRRNMEAPEITITDADLEKLAAIVETLAPSTSNGLEHLDEELGRARVVPQTAVEPDVVTMNSRVRYLEELDGVTREITLVYPAAADATSARVSVLAPVGSALLGLRVGQAIEWPMPDGRKKRYRVVAVPYQPEAAGHFHL